jgi:hypothetical protein
MIDASIAAICFWLIGYGLAYGTDGGYGFIGTDNFGCDVRARLAEEKSGKSANMLTDCVRVANHKRVPRLGRMVLPVGFHWSLRNYRCGISCRAHQA